MRARLLSKHEFHRFLEKLKSQGTLVAPVKEDIVRFKEITDVSAITTEGHPLFPLKKYFSPQKRKIFTYENNNIEEVLPEKQYIMFGARLCDINALLRLDKLFLGDISDRYYQRARANNLIIGLHCEIPPNEMCFCESMGLSDSGYDLLFCDAGENFHIKVGSERGNALVQDLPESDFQPEPIKTEKKLHNTEIAAFFENDAWKKEVEKCLSCGACTTLCPTCLCFDVYDDPDVEMNKGARITEWDSCQYEDFTKVAGGHVFRQAREQRFRHRIFHKIQYYKDQFGEFMCTGCGRCIEGCPTKIDFVEILNGMKQ